MKGFARVLGDRLPPSPRGGFTLVEVLATIVLIAIALPAIMNGISTATQLGSDARRRTDAAALAESKLAEIVATNEWQNAANGGDFGPDWPDYRWDMSIAPWAPDTSQQQIQQIDLRVSWRARGRQQSMTLSTLAYQRQQQQ